MQTALLGHEKKVLGFTYCIRTLLRDISIFEHVLPPLHQREYIEGISRHVDARLITLSFDGHISWTLDTLTTDTIEWLSSTAASTTSKVGILSSPKFRSLVTSCIDFQACVNFQQMLYAQTLAYTQLTIPDEHGLNAIELQQVAANAGHSFLMKLDRKLTPTNLANCSRDSLQALVLITLGTILAVGYASPPTNSPAFVVQDETNQVMNPESKTLYTIMQEHLCQTLAHYLVYLATKIGLSIPRNLEQILIETAHTRWGKKGRFSWLKSSCKSECYEDDAIGGADINEDALKFATEITTLMDDQSLDPIMDLPIDYPIQSMIDETLPITSPDPGHDFFSHLPDDALSWSIEGSCTSNIVYDHKFPEINLGTYEIVPLEQRNHDFTAPYSHLSSCITKTLHSNFGDDPLNLMAQESATTIDMYGFNTQEPQIWSLTSSGGNSHSYALSPRPRRETVISDHHANGPASSQSDRNWVSTMNLISQQMDPFKHDSYSRMVNSSGGRANTPNDEPQILTREHERRSHSAGMKKVKRNRSSKLSGSEHAMHNAICIRASPFRGDRVDTLETLEMESHPMSQILSSGVTTFPDICGRWSGPNGEIFGNCDGVFIRPVVQTENLLV